MRLQQYLQEGIKLNKPVKVTKSTIRDWRAKFKVGEKEFEFLAITNIGGPEATWEVQFQTDETYDMGITGDMGNKALEVFSYVGSAFVKFITDVQPKYFEFGADLAEKSRIQLYDRLTKMIGRKFGYKTSSKPDWDEMVYYFEKEK